MQNVSQSLAGRTGQLLNMNEIGTSCGVNHNTIKSWIHVLEASFLIKLIRPYFKNINKRLIKAPKLFFLDTGLVCYLLGIKSFEQIFSHPLKGAIFETLVFSEILKTQYNRGNKEDVYFLRDKKGHEIDFLIDKGIFVDLCEVKSASTITSDFFKNLKYYSKTELQITNKFLIYGGDEEKIQNEVNIMPWQNVEKLFE